MTTHWPPLVIGAILVGLAVFVYRANSASWINRWFSAYALSAAGWSFGISAVYSGKFVELFGRVPFAAAALIPISLLAFVDRFPRPTANPHRGMRRLLWTLGFSLSVMSLSTDWVVTGISLVDSQPERTPGILYPAFAAYFGVAWTTVMGSLVWKWRDTEGHERAHLTYLVTAMCIAMTAAMISNLVHPLITGKSTYAWLGPYFCLVFIFATAHSVIRHRVMDLRVVIRRGLTFAIAIIASLAPVVALLLLFGPRLSLHLNSGEALFGLAAILVVALLVPITRDITSKLLDRYVYRRRANYQRTIREASRALTRVLNLRTLVKYMEDTISETVECEGVVLYARKQTDLRRSGEGRKGDDVSFGAPIAMPTEILRQLEIVKDVLVTEELSRVQTRDLRDLQSELQQLNWALVLPAISENTVIGAIVLGPKRSGDPYYPHDLDLLMTLANQAGIAIKNAQLYAQVVLANEYLENIVATMTSGVVAVDPDGVITMFNPAAEGMTGLTHGQVHGQPLPTLPAVLASAVADALRDDVARTQLEVGLSDGTVTRPVMCASAPLRDPEGTLIGAVAVFSDLTPVRELEIQRRRAERLAYLETFAAGIAHEVKNPLVAIKTFTQLVPRRRLDEQFVDEFSRICGREIIRMERLIERLRTLSRPGLRPHRVVDVRQPMGDALEFMQATFEEKGAAIEATLGDAEAPVLGDGHELEQLFLNLLMNANEATSAGARIGVTIAREDGRIVVSISDSGPGIPADELKRVFDPFYTTKERGSGLGLYVCVGIAETHSARLHAENVPTGGARFNVEFPMASEVSAAVAS